eukprot:Skav210423  [mRNA]  locus=scaffold1573:338040:344165:+ [translate_table: standard]
MVAYQHPFLQTLERRKQRDAWWQLLSTYLDGLAARNLLVLGGDFNTGLAANPPHVGCNSFKHQDRVRQGRLQTDSDTFASLLEQHGLIALNTFATSQPPTYVQGLDASRIDYILLRLNRVDSAAKHPATLLHSPFVNNTYGHLPLIASIPRHWHPHRRPKQHGYTHVHRQQCNLAVQTDDRVFSTQVTQALEAFVLDTHPVDQYIPRLHAAVAPAIQALTKPTPPAEDDQVGTILDNKWDHFRHMQRCTTCTIPQLFSFWKHWCRFHRLKKYHRQYNKQRKREQANQLIAEAGRCARIHDSQGLYGLVRKFTPKARNRPIHLRSKHGTLACAVEELSIYRAYIMETWHGPETLEHSFGPPGVPFSEQQIVDALSRIPCSKATAPPFTPGIIWKTWCQLIGPHLHQHLAEWWNCAMPSLPQQWRDSWLKFIDKPHKSNDNIKNLRPLALGEPLGRALTGLLTDSAASACFPIVCAMPQYAFVKHRSTLDAIQRVISHCRLVREAVKGQRPTVAARAAGHRTQPLIGGVQLLVDLSQAYDHVDRQWLFDHLTMLPIPHDVLRLILLWHSHTRYHFAYQRETHAIDVGGGLKQGCKIAPLLWSLTMLIIMNGLQSLISPDWLLQSFTAFADDIHLAEQVQSKIDFHQCLERFGRVLHFLQTLGFTINPSKSHVLISLGGSQAAKVMAQHIRKGKDGTQLAIPLPNNTWVYIPVVSQTRYLGVQISYKQFEDQTVAFRISQAQSTFSRLRRWLRSRAIPARTRLQMWQTCVWSTLTYGIMATGFHLKHVHRIQQTAYKQIRFVLFDHAYRSHRTHQEVLRAVQFPPPLELLHRICTTLLRTVQSRLQHASDADIIRRGDWHHLHDIESMIASEIASGPLVPIAQMTEPVETRHQLCCHMCNFTTTSKPNLTRHYTNIHNMSMHRVAPIVPSQSRLPTCPFCNHTFATFPGLRNHLELGRCPVRPSLTPLIEPDPLDYLRSTTWGERLLQQLGQWQLIVEDRETCAALTTTCALCGAWQGRMQEMSLHYQHHHHDHVPYMQPLAQQLIRLMKQEDNQISTCGFCLVKFKMHHTCPVASQLAAILRDTQDPVPLLTCMMCDEPHDSLGDLQLHLLQQHEMKTIQWNSGRDALRGEARCRHCHQQYSSMNGLKNHIQFGRCPDFDLMAPVQTPGVDTRLQLSFWSGQLLQTLEDPDLRLALAHTCQVCEREYDRSADLAVHIQQSHADLFHRGLRLQKWLIQRLYSNLGCLCAPVVETEGSQHVCPLFMQVAILHVQERLRIYAGPVNEFPGHAGVLVPGFFEEARLEELLHPSLAKPARDAMISCLCFHDWSQLWTNPEIYAVTRCCCITCGHGPMTPGMLHNHVLEEHRDSYPSYKHLLTQMLDPMWHMNSSKHTCDGCKLTFTLPDSMLQVSQCLAQEHFGHQCPVALQAACILSCFIDGTHVRGSAGGVGRADGRILPSPGEVLAPRAVRAPRRQAPQRSDGAPDNTKRRRTSKGDGAPDGRNVPSGVAARGQPGQLTLPGLLRHVHEPRGGRSAEGLGGSGGDLETTGNDCVFLGPSEGPPPADLAAGIATEAGPVERQAEREAVAGDPAIETPPVGGRELALPQVEPIRTTHDPGHQDDCSDNDHGEQDAGRDGGSDDRRGGDREIQLTGPHDRRLQSQTSGDPLETAIITQKRHPVESLPKTFPLHPLELTGGPDETSFPNHGRPSSTPSTPAGPDGDEGPGKGEVKGQEQAGTSQEGMRPLTSLARVRLANPGNHCYVNASIKALLWTQMSSGEPVSRFWGDHTEEIIAWLLSVEGSSSHFTLLEQHWLAAFKDLWGPVNRQADVAEFTQKMLQWLSPRAIMCWERRLEGKDEPPHNDRSEGDYPIVLQPEQPSLPYFTVQSLVDLWSQELNMTKALLAKDPIICCHLDRFAETSAGRVRLQGKLQLCSPTLFPVFDDKGTITYEAYETMACVLHAGSLTRGHYRVALRLCVPDWGKWLLCDDARAPEILEELTEAMMKQITLVWLCNRDALLMPIAVDTSTWTPVPGTPAALLAMLARS